MKFHLQRNPYGIHPLGQMEDPAASSTSSATAVLDEQIPVSVYGGPMPARLHLSLRWTSNIQSF